MLLISLDSLMKCSKPTIDLVYISHEVYLCYTLVLNWSHQILLVFYRLFRQLIQIKTDLFKVKFYLIITVLDLEDGLLQAWKRIILLNFNVPYIKMLYISPWELYKTCLQWWLNGDIEKSGWTTMIHVIFQWIWWVFERWFSVICIIIVKSTGTLAFIA